MKALTLTQPWATLVATREKMIETRSWPTKFRGVLAIHAAQGLGSVGGMRGLAALCDGEPFFTALRPHLSGYTALERAQDLPRGGIVAIAELTDVVPVAGWAISEQERAFGDYSPGRYAWVLERVVNIHDPVECKGALGLWNVPGDVVSALARMDHRIIRL